MADYTSNLDATQAAELLGSARHVIVTAHAKPDGDAFGAVVALTAALTSGGAEVSAQLAGPVPANFRKLAGYDLVTHFEPQVEWPAADLLVIVDTGAWAQIEPMRAQIEPLLQRTLIIDHHVSGDVPAPRRFIDSNAAATCEMLGTVIQQLGGGDEDMLANRTVAEALFVGLASDTGWFRFSNTRPATLELAARLLTAGVDQASLHRTLEQTARIEKLRLMTCALSSLRLSADGRLALMVLRAQDFAQCGAYLDETERFVDLPQAIESVQVVVLLTEPPEVSSGSQKIRLSFRSKPGDDAVDVAALAEQFGGGGHRRAAGAKAVGPVDQVIERVEKAVAAALGS
jgi:phosphoesterase RecJ-like protein